MATRHKRSPINVEAWPDADQALFAAWRETYPDSGNPLLDRVLAFLSANGIPQPEGAHIHISWTQPGSLLLGAKTLRVWSEADFVAQFQSWVDGCFPRLTGRGVFNGVNSVASLNDLVHGLMAFSVEVTFQAWPRREVAKPLHDLKPENVFTSQSSGWPRGQRRQR